MFGKQMETEEERQEKCAILDSMGIGGYGIVQGTVTLQEAKQLAEAQIAAQYNSPERRASNFIASLHKKYGGAK